MINLLKVDFKRILKDKLLIIVCIIALVMSLFMPLLFKGITQIGGGLEDGLSIENVSLGFFSNAFAAGSNVGLILPIFVAIIINKDFSYGTIRNKIICGNKRSSIFLSTFITSATITVAIMIIQALITLIATIVLFGGVKFSGSDISYLFQTILYGILLYVFISALVSFLAVWAKNVGLIIVCYVAISMFCSFAGTIIIGLQAFVQKEMIVKFLEFINNINLYYADGGILSIFGIGEAASYSLKDILFKTITPIVYTIGLLGIGIFVFNKKDVK